MIPGIHIAFFFLNFFRMQTSAMQWLILEARFVSSLSCIYREKGWENILIVDVDSIFLGAVSLLIFWFFFFSKQKTKEKRYWVRSGIYSFIFRCPLWKPEIWVFVPVRCALVAIYWVKKGEWVVEGRRWVWLSALCISYEGC